MRDKEARARGTSTSSCLPNPKQALSSCLDFLLGRVAPEGTPHVPKLKDVHRPAAIVVVRVEDMMQLIELTLCRQAHTCMTITAREAPTPTQLTQILRVFKLRWKAGGAGLHVIALQLHTQLGVSTEHGARGACDVVPGRRKHRT